MSAATDWIAIGGRIETASQEVDGWFLSLCLDCEPLLEQPFRDAAARDAWRSGHGEGTGHRVVAIDCGPLTSSENAVVG